MKALSCLNPVIVIPSQSLEKMEMKECKQINKLFRLNLQKIIANKESNKKDEIICLHGKMYYNAKTD